MKIKRFALTVVLAVFSVSILTAQSEKAEKVLDLRIVADTSPPLAKGWAGTVDWLCGIIVDNMLEDGDYFFFVTAGETEKVVFDGLIIAESKEALKAKIRALPAPSVAASGNVTEALRTVQKRGAAENAIPVTMLVCGSEISADSAMLKYARTENFAYWRAVTLAPSLEAGVEKALKKALNN